MLFVEGHVSCGKIEMDDQMENMVFTKRVLCSSLCMMACVLVF